MNTPEQRDVLGPEELSRLLHAAVEPLRPSPEAYQRIQAGVERRGRWRAPLFAAGGVVLAGVVALAVLLLRPSQQNHVIEVQPPISLTVGTQDGTASGPGPHPTNSPSHGGTGPSSSASTGPGTSDPTTGHSTSTGSVSPSASSHDPGSPTRPTPVARPAKAGDIDGDGTVDSIRPSGTGVVVSLSRGGSASVPLPAGSTPGASTAVDLDGDGFAELIIQTGSSNGVATYAVARYLTPRDIELVPAPPRQIAAGTDNSGEGWGFSCGSNGIQFVDGKSSDGGQTYQVTTTTLKPTFDGWSQQGSPATSTMAAAAATPSFAARCGSLG
ncbi:FG-GAP repeat domain-containing protein [Pseudofrankia inefficax]|uniref:FG-GAP repeat protein n=1 Tax=Pseudofrankia inefficax (strain DSM 45817 / CECT 9037 / DDB 130130 / EuI1c) TaxID=298654 RepID=E3IXL4_PSEI1|nr:VCBS repeat-containing protein [Pseudofrankia inefficax]ADP79031.1 FG-GAP repeat protein [Pseudofrankia inefficax]